MKAILSCVALSLVLFSCSTKKDLTTSEVSTNPPSVSSDYHLEIGHHREKYKVDFLKNERSPLTKKDFQYMHFFDADDAYRCDCTFELTPDAKPFEMATYSGETRPYTTYGKATCQINGNQLILSIYSSKRTQAIPGYADHLFIPFKDETNSDTTYGGGRYIDIVKGDIVNGKVTLDFNKCYNPWCAYSDGYSCPIPPRENHLSMEIPAGEKMWTGKKK